MNTKAPPAGPTGRPEPLSPQITAASVVPAAGAKPARERKSGADARVGPDRRAQNVGHSDGERRSGLDRRRGPGRRRTDYRRAAEDGHMNEEQLDFIKALDEYKRVNAKPFPTWTEVLDLVLYLGYRRVAPVGEFKLSKGRQTPPRRSPEPED